MGVHTVTTPHLPAPEASGMVLPEEAAVALSAAVHPHPAEATQVVPAQDHGGISDGG